MRFFTPAGWGSGGGLVVCGGGDLLQLLKIFFFQKQFSTVHVEKTILIAY